MDGIIALISAEKNTYGNVLGRADIYTLANIAVFSSFESKEALSAPKTAIKRPLRTGGIHDSLNPRSQSLHENLRDAKNAENRLCVLLEPLTMSIAHRNVALFFLRNLRKIKRPQIKKEKKLKKFKKWGSVGVAKLLTLTVNA